MRFKLVVQTINYSLYDDTILAICTILRIKYMGVERMAIVMIIPFKDHREILVKRNLKSFDQNKRFF